MGKLYRYELHRFVCCKLFFGALAVLLLFGWQALRSETILGVADTAPFSPWSFGSYAARALPFLAAAQLCFLLRLYSRKARGVRTLTAAAPIPPGRYLFLQASAAASAVLLLGVCHVLLGLLFLLRLFGSAVSLPQLVLAALTALLPPSCLLLGLGLLTAPLHPAFPVLASAAAWAAALLLAGGLSPFDAGLFTALPLAAELPDPAFRLPAAVWASRLLALLLGLALLAAAIRRAGRAQKRLR